MTTTTTTTTTRPAARRHHPLVAVGLAAVVAATAIGDVTASGSVARPERAATRSVACPGLPRGLALIGNGPHRVWRVTRTGMSAVAGVRRGTVIRKAVRGRDGTIWVEVGRPRPYSLGRSIRRISPDGSRRTSQTGDVFLSHVGSVGRARRTTVATYIDVTGWRAREDPYGGVFIESSAGNERKIANAGGDEHFVASAAPAILPTRRGRLASVVALGRVEDLNAGVSEDFAFLRLRDGVARRLHDPSEDEPFTPPQFQQPILSPGGAKLSWVEGPQWIDGYRRLVGDWKLVVADSESGAESVRVWVGRRQEHLFHADYDGRYWVGTFLRPEDQPWKPGDLRIRVVDTRAANPHVVGARCSTGFVASIDRFVSSNQPPTQES